MRWEAAASAVSPALPRAVWDVLLDGARWSFWNPGVEWLWLEGDATAGTLATIKLRRVRQTAMVIAEAAAPKRFALQLTVGPAARMLVGWTLSEHLGGTRIDAAIEINGIAAGVLLKRSAMRVGAALPTHLERLAERAALDEKNTRLE